jgi:D-3-phosphoglycerate dehydrogenase
VPGAPPLIVIADPIDPGAVGRLREGPCAVVDASASTAALAEKLGSAWALVVRSRTQVTAAMIAQAPHLAVIARAGVGVDNVDVPAATARGIRVVNAPTAATTSVAELTVALILWLVRDLSGPVAATRAGSWKRGLVGHELAGKTVGFIGYGRIAREVAARLAPFGVSTVAFDPFIAVAVDATELLSLDDLLARADIVSLHAALTPENRHLIDARRLAQLRPGSFLVNVARGPLVDEAALLAALTSGHLAGAALDVYEVEPPTLAALLQHPKLIPTPHLGASTPEAQGRAGMAVVDELLRALHGEPLKFQVNPEVRSAP